MALGPSPILSQGSLIWKWTPKAGCNVWQGRLHPFGIGELKSIGVWAWQVKPLFVLAPGNPRYHRKSWCNWCNSSPKIKGYNMIKHDMIKKKLMYRDPRWSKAKIWLSANLGFHHRLWPIPSGCKMQEGEASQRSFKECSCKRTKEPTSCDTFSYWVAVTVIMKNESLGLTSKQTTALMIKLPIRCSLLERLAIVCTMSKWVNIWARSITEPSPKERPIRHRFPVSKRFFHKGAVQISSVDLFFAGFIYIYIHYMHITCLKSSATDWEKAWENQGNHTPPKRTWQEQLVRSNGSWDPGSPATSTGLQGLRWQVRGA